jgi:hypothetical protein
MHLPITIIKIICWSTLTILLTIWTNRNPTLVIHRPTIDICPPAANKDDNKPAVANKSSPDATDARLCWHSDVGKQSSSSPLFATVRDWKSPEEAFADSPRPTGFKNFAFTATTVFLTPALRDPTERNPFSIIIAFFGSGSDGTLYFCSG